MNTSADNKKETTQTNWAPIFKDMVILMCVMGLVALLCKLIMMPFEITTPTDSLVSLIRKGGVTAEKQKDAADGAQGTPRLVVCDTPYLKELKKVLGEGTVEEKSMLDSLMESIGLGQDAAEAKTNNINAQDNTGRTPLMWAVYSNYNKPPMSNVSEELFEQVNDELKTFYNAFKDAKTPKDQAKIKADYAELSAHLQELAESVANDTPTFWNKKDVMRLYYVRSLLQAPGINPNLTDKDGFTALHWAAWSGMPFCSLTLVQAGLDINAKENNGYTPLMLAALRGNADTVEMLLKLGADTSVTNAKGDTALSLASAAATSYHKSDNWVYKLIYSDSRNDFYVNTVKYLKNGVTPTSGEELEKQMNTAWSRYEKQLLTKASKTEKATENAEIKAEEHQVQDAAGEPAYSGDAAQENP